MLMVAIISEGCRDLENQCRGKTVLDGAANLDAADVGQPDIEKHQFRVPLTRELQRFMTRRRLDDLEPGMTEDAAASIAPGLVIIDIQDQGASQKKGPS